MGKLPAILLYDGDWLKDSIAGCSLAAQGLWLRMMFIGHNSERYGYLQQNGVPIPPESIARRCGCTLAEYTTLLCELDAASVPSRTPEGIIFSRRMVRDANERAQAKVRKQKQRSRSCHADVTPIEDVTVNVPVVDVAFEVEAFDFDLAFNALFKIYPRRKDNHLTRKNFIDAVEKVSKRHGFRRSEAAAYILSRTEIYVSKCKFIKGLDAYLYDEIYEQDESMWDTVVQKGDGNDKRNRLSVFD